MMTPLKRIRRGRGLKCLSPLHVVIALYTISLASVNAYTSAAGLTNIYSGIGVKSKGGLSPNQKVKFRRRLQGSEEARSVKRIHQKGARKFLRMGLASVIKLPTKRGFIEYASSYSDLSSVPSLMNCGFLLTNTAYFLAGSRIRSSERDSTLGAIMILSGCVSCLYHGTQVLLGPRSPIVVTALYIDYVGAFTAMGSTLLRIGYLIGAGNFPFLGIATGVSALVAFFKGSQFSAGIPYVVWHSLWHFLSAGAVYFVAMS